MYKEMAVIWWLCWKCTHPTHWNFFFCQAVLIFWISGFSIVWTRTVMWNWFTLRRRGEYNYYLYSVTRRQEGGSQTPGNPSLHAYWHMLSDGARLQLELSIRHKYNHINIAGMVSLSPEGGKRLVREDQSESYRLRITYCKGLEGVVDLMLINCVLILFIF